MSHVVHPITPNCALWMKLPVKEGPDDDNPVAGHKTFRVPVNFIEKKQGR